MSFADDIRKKYQPQSPEPLPSLHSVADIFYKDMKAELMRQAKSGSTTKMDVAMGFKRINVVITYTDCYIHKGKRFWIPSSDDGAAHLTVCDKKELNEFVSIIKQKCQHDGINLKVKKPDRYFPMEDLTIILWIEV